MILTTILFKLFIPFFFLVLGGLSTLLWYLSSISDISKKILEKEDLILKVTEKTIDKIDFLNQKSTIIEKSTTSDTFTIICGLGVVLVVVILGFTIIYFSSNSVDIANIITDSNYENVKTINYHINAVSKEINKTVLETGNRVFENQQHIVETLTTLSITDSDPTTVLIDSVLQDPKYCDQAAMMCEALLDLF